jgi:outer membrane receptor protein involved in Fe transport
MSRAQQREQIGRTPDWSRSRNLAQQIRGSTPHRAHCFVARTQQQKRSSSSCSGSNRADDVGATLRDMDARTTTAEQAERLFISQDPNAALLGKRPVAIPTFLASLWGDYTFKTGPLAGVGFGAGARRVGDSFADQANTMVVPARTLFDAALHYEYKQWRAALNVSNLADKIFVSSCDGLTSCFYGERRRATLSLAYRW